MNLTELRKMRLKQAAILNGIMFTGVITFFIVVNVFPIKIAHVFFITGVIILVQSIFLLIKGDSTKSFIPTFEQVAIYEKQKMGKEWYKQRKVAYISNLILSVFMFLQFYWYRHTMIVLQIDLIFMFIILCFFLAIVNISLFIHSSKIDYSTSDLDMKGYTRKWVLISMVLGVILASLMIGFTFFYAISRI